MRLHAYKGVEWWRSAGQPFHCHILEHPKGAVETLLACIVMACVSRRPLGVHTRRSKLPNQPNIGPTLRIKPIASWTLLPFPLIYLVADLRNRMTSSYVVIVPCSLSNFTNSDLPKCNFTTRARVVWFVELEMCCWMYCDMVTADLINSPLASVLSYMDSRCRKSSLYIPVAMIL